MQIAENHILVIFGASGDLTKRKLIPSLFNLCKQNMLPEAFAIVGVGRSKLSDSDFRKRMKNAIDEYSDEAPDEKLLNDFINKLFYQDLETSTPDEYCVLSDKLNKVEKEINIGGNRIYYLSTPPSLYGVIPENLGMAGLADTSTGWKRLIVEKPFGYDLESSINLNTQIKKHFSEEQIFRIDHYLGKETVQNVLVTRFSNGIFEPLWNRNYIHHVEITSAESIGVENRGGYYDKSGAMRDMIQNHLLQVAALIAMEAPASFDSNAIRNEIVKVFESLRPIEGDDVYKNVIRGQYLSSTIKGENVKGYREESGVDENSVTETYAAIKFFIDNWRWGGVPFYLRSGKRLPTRVTEVVIHFDKTPHFLFNKQDEQNACNQLIIRIQPDEGILLKFGMKVPGSGFNIQNVNMDFHYSDLTNAYVPQAYERLLYDCMIGDSTLYARGDAVEAAWKFIDPIINSWQNDKRNKVYGYPAGTWGPEHADSLIEDKSINWRYPCKNLSNDGNYCEL